MAKRQARPGDVVEVLWRDSELLMKGWRSPRFYRQAARRDGAERSAGYLVDRRRSHLLLTLSFAPRAGTITDAIRIPMSAVRSIRVLGRAYRPARRAMRG